MTLVFFTVIHWPAAYRSRSQQFMTRVLCRPRQPAHLAELVLVSAYRSPYLVVALAAGAAAEGGLAAGRVRRCGVVRAGSVICGGRSWAPGGSAGVREVARRAGHCPRGAVLIAARAGRRPPTWMVPGAVSREPLTCWPPRCLAASSPRCLAASPRHYHDATFGTCVLTYQSFYPGSRGIGEKPKSEGRVTSKA